MGYYKCRRPGYMSARQILICEAVFQGKSNDWIYKNIFFVKDGDDRARKNASSQLSAAKRNPKFIEYYNSMVTEFRVHNYGKAMHKLSELVDDPNPWVAIQASNSMLNHTEKAVVGEEEKTITIKVEGMPALGTPEESPLALPDGVQEAIEEAKVIVEAQVV